MFRLLFTFICMVAHLGTLENSSLGNLSYVVTSLQILLLEHRVQVISALHSGSRAILQGQARGSIFANQHFLNVRDQVVSSFAVFLNNRFPGFNLRDSNTQGLGYDFGIYRSKKLNGSDNQLGVRFTGWYSGLGLLYV